MILAALPVLEGKNVEKFKCRH